MPRVPTHPKLRTALRKTAKWGGVGATVVLVVVWVASAWWAGLWGIQSGLHVRVEEGCVYVIQGEPLPGIPILGRGALLTHHRWPLLWWFASGGSQTYSYTQVPLWAPALLTLAFTVFAWRRDASIRRLQTRGFCPCGYDRAGLAAGAVCPECGAAPPPASLAAAGSAAPAR